MNESFAQLLIALSFFAISMGGMWVALTRDETTRWQRKLIEEDRAYWMKHYPASTPPDKKK